MTTMSSTTLIGSLHSTHRLECSSLQSHVIFILTDVAVQIGYS